MPINNDRVTCYIVRCFVNWLFLCTKVDLFAALTGDEMRDSKCIAVSG